MKTVSVRNVIFGFTLAIIGTLVVNCGDDAATTEEQAAEELRVAQMKVELLESTPADFLESKDGEIIMVVWRARDELRYQRPDMHPSDRVTIDSMAHQIIKIYKYNTPDWIKAARRYVRPLLPKEQR